MKRRVTLNLHPGRNLLLVVAGFVALATVPASGQEKAAPAAARLVEEAAAPVYDVVSIREFKREPGGYRAEMRFNPDGFAATAFSLKSLMCTAFGVSFYQVSGGPDWVESGLYTVQAKMDEPATDVLAKLPPDQAWKMRQRMFQAVLADRFKLTVHRETRQLPIFALMIAKSQPKFSPAQPVPPAANDGSGPNPPRPRGTMSMRGGPDGMLLTAQGATMDQLAAQLAGQLHTRVENNTGLTGKYDFTLHFASDNGLNGSNSDTVAPSVFTAVQEQLGLKLESRKGPVEVLIVDHVERPSEN
jgi:uncharacterized protein (TIGR03435 family)